MDKLKPCPFCGSEAELVVLDRTVRVLKNSVTGDVSVSWWEEKMEE